MKPRSGKVSSNALEFVSSSRCRQTSGELPLLLNSGVLALTGISTERRRYKQPLKSGTTNGVLTLYRHLDHGFKFCFTGNGWPKR